MRKNIWWILCTIVLATTAFFAVFYNNVSDSSICFRIENESGDSEVVTAFEAEEGNYYVFLPSYAKMEKVKYEKNTAKTVSIDGIKLSEGMSCEAFVLETEYELSVDREKQTTIQFLRSADVATLYIDTASGSMENIHNDKNYEERASVRLLTKSGVVDHSDELGALKGRGNYTWLCEKKSYVLTLSEAGNLLDMGDATKWILLANPTDETNLNNKLVFDLAGRVGSVWTPECQYVDVFLNGEYNGLYLLAEKVEAGTERLNINTQSGDFLCTVDLKDRWDTLSNPFSTQSGRTVELCEPKNLTDETIEKVNQFEQALFSGADINSGSNIDLDSWVRRYLIDEISGNIDSDIASSYFYYSDGKFYAGPIWDYDMTFGNNVRNKYPNALIAKHRFKSSIMESPYYDAFYENETFYNRMVKIYQTDFLKELDRLINGGIKELADSIECAKKMNSLRWSGMFQRLCNENSTIPMTVDMKIDYLKTRVKFLNDIWLDGTEYCTVKLEVSKQSPYHNISVEKGWLLETSYLNLEKTVWLIEGTQTEFDPTQPITEDLILVKQTTQNTQIQETENQSSSISLRGYISIFIIFVFGLLLASILFVDLRRISRKRRN